MALRGTLLCLRHLRQVEWQLDALGLGLEHFNGAILDLLDADKTSDMSRLLSYTSRTGQTEQAKPGGWRAYRANPG
jgi:hypothetical protein